MFTVWRAFNEAHKDSQFSIQLTLYLEIVNSKKKEKKQMFYTNTICLKITRNAHFPRVNKLAVS